MSTQLTGAIRTCHVDTSYADKVQSDRFLNPNEALCPVWTGRDNAGRQANVNSFMSEKRGCGEMQNHRIEVENNVGRPQYVHFATLHSQGIKNPNIHHMAANTTHEQKDLVNGSFGQGVSYAVNGACKGSNPRRFGAMDAQKHRQKLSVAEGASSNSYQRSAGNSRYVSYGNM
ncbi:hypothetical protein OAF54_03135 [bacterium]|nr:hypothetical protein [bacterium]